MCTARTFRFAMIFEKFDSWQQAAQLTDTDVGAIAGCSHTTIGRLKRGEIFLEPFKRQLICDASGGALKPADFAEFEDDVVRERKRAEEAA